MADPYAPPRPRSRAKNSKEQQHVQGARAKNKTYIWLLATCLLVSVAMNWVAINVTGKQGGTAGHIEAYLRKFLGSTGSASTAGSRADGGLMRGTGSRREQASAQVAMSAFSLDDVKNDDSDSDNSDGDATDDNNDDAADADEEDDDDNKGDDNIDSKDDNTDETAQDLDDDEKNDDQDEETDEDSDVDDAKGKGETTKTNVKDEESYGDRPVEFGGPPPDEAGTKIDASSAASAPAADKSDVDEEELRPIEDGGPPAIDGRGNAGVNHTEHSIGGLSCAKYGGPSDRIAEEMVYWKHIPSDAEFVSPLKGDGPTKYMTFEPDGGGWNNIRMAMETVVAIAHAMGRVLVMPPKQRFYLLGKNENRQRNHFGFADFYHLESLSREHAGLDIISMQDFLEREAMTGRMLSRKTGLPSYPPGNRTDWNGENGQGINLLYEWLRKVTHVPQWKPDECIIAFPASRGTDAATSLEEVQQNMKGEIRPIGMGPVPADAPALDRMHEVANGRSMCMYDEKMQKDPHIHFATAHKLGLRLLVHFYVFLFFEDWRWDTWTKRFVRDHLRYVDELQCAAARAVHAIRERVRTSKSMLVNTTVTFYDSLHVRRGDFQYKDTKIDALELYEASKKELLEGGTVYVATDEKDREFFKPLEEHYDLCFLDDFKHLFEGLNTNLYGMLDQLIASKGRVFYGTYYSTFTGFINRMRGYHAEKAKLGGYQNGTIQSYFFVPQVWRYDMAKFKAPRPPYWAREFPIAWRDIDKGVGDLPAASLKKNVTDTGNILITCFRYNSRIIPCAKKINPAYFYYRPCCQAILLLVKRKIYT